MKLTMCKVFAILFTLAVSMPKKCRTLMAGLVELFGAFALWLPGALGLLEPKALFGTSVGAFYCHLRFDTWKYDISAMVTMLLLAVLVFQNASIPG